MSEPDYLMAIATVAENLAFLMPIGPAEECPKESIKDWFCQVQVDWVGPDGSRGRIVVALDRGCAQATAANLLGLAQDEVPGDPEIHEACNELANVIAGNLLPVRYGHDHEFHLHPPDVVPIALLSGRVVVRLALMEGVIGVSIDGDTDNSRILRAVQLPPGFCA